jgi:hypothetical protein
MNATMIYHYVDKLYQDYGVLLAESLKDSRGWWKKLPLRLTEIARIGGS